MAPMTLYRAIHAGEFPAVKIRGRYVIPARALDELERAAVDTNGLVTSAEVVPGEGTA
jgi:excisionase family DNA binding protein